MKKFVDDGRTVYDMSNVGVGRTENKKDEGVKLRRKEKTAAIRAGFAVYTPIFLGVIACFTLVAVGLYFWLK
ncbi:MAG: hypothetical protein ACI4SK_06280 [Christensenellales bacterium]